VTGALGPAEPTWLALAASSEWHYAEAKRLGRLAFAKRCNMASGAGQCQFDAGHTGACRPFDQPGAPR
jgi:hypothetical protein